MIYSQLVYEISNISEEFVLMFGSNKATEEKKNSEAEFHKVSITDMCFSWNEKGGLLWTMQHSFQATKFKLRDSP